MSKCCSWKSKDVEQLRRLVFVEEGVAIIRCQSRQPALARLQFITNTANSISLSQSIQDLVIAHIIESHQCHGCQPVNHNNFRFVCELSSYLTSDMQKQFQNYRCLKYNRYLLVLEICFLTEQWANTHPGFVDYSQLEILKLLCGKIPLILPTLLGTVGQLTFLLYPPLCLMILPGKVSSGSISATASVPSNVSQLTSSVQICPEFVKLRSQLASLGGWYDIFLLRYKRFSF